MRWPLAVLVAYFTIGLELALRPELALGPEGGGSGVSPSFVLPLVIYIAMFAPQVTALWTALVLGLVMDLTAPRPGPPQNEALYVVGPNAFALIAAAYLTLTVRGLLFRRNWFSLLALTIAGGVLGQIVLVTLFSVRAWFGDPSDWSPGHELWTRLLSAGYSGATAIVMALPLFAMHKGFHFTEPNRGFSVKRY